LKKHSIRNRQTAKSANGTRMTGYTIGLDVSDRYSYAAVLNAEGELVEQERLRSREPELRRWLSARPASVVALETGTHSRWMAKAARECGHQVLVANARELRLIYGGHTKTDQLDAVKLARLARVDAQLLRPIEHRGEKEHADLALIKTRDALVRARTDAINLVRGMVKSAGKRVPASSSEGFAARAAGELPELLRNALAPMLEHIDELNEHIREYDERIEHIARTEYPETALLKQVAGVGTVTALTFRLKVGAGERFAHSRDVGSYVGLRPKRDQSGEQDAQLGITKAGDPLLRRLLVNCAHYILGRFGPDSDLRRWGLGLANRSGGKNAKKRAIVAVARKLAVLLHRLLVTGEVYEPLRHTVGRGRLAVA
jgi:transposase